MYIWQASDWPIFQFDKQALTPALNRVLATQKRLLGEMPMDLQDMRFTAAKPSETQNHHAVDSANQVNMLLQNALIQNALSTSAIEGELLDVGSVRSSVARHLGLETAGVKGATKQSDALVCMLLAAMDNLSQPLTLTTLCDWQSLLFPELPLAEKLIVGALRDDHGGETPMQVVSVKKGRYVVHFEAPPSSVLVQQLSAFLAWFNGDDPALAQAHSQAEMHPFIRAGIAHLWFVTLHPFDDGNGRLARAITDRALAQAENTAVRFYSMSATIETHRNAYYEQLEQTQNRRSHSQLDQSGDAPVLRSMDVTSWLDWFLTMLNEAMEKGCDVIERVAAKSRFWYRHSQTVLHERQIKVLNRLLDNYGDEFPHGINASKYQSLAKVSKATATRDLTDLLNKQCIEKRSAGGRSTRYQVLLR